MACRFIWKSWNCQLMGLVMTSQDMASLNNIYKIQEHLPNICVIDQVAWYVIFKEECIKNGKQEPNNDGVLLFDEVKMACQLIWKLWNCQLMGLIMTSQDMASLNDIYKIQELTKHPIFYSSYGGTVQTIMTLLVHTSPVLLWWKINLLVCVLETKNFSNIMVWKLVSWFVMKDQPILQQSKLPMVVMQHTW